MNLSSADRPDRPPYLQPYFRAAARHGSGFPSLLWASPSTQSQRFEILSQLAPLHGKSLLDAGCGRADLLEFLLSRDVAPADYIGIEAVSELAEAAEQRLARRSVIDRIGTAMIVQADFVRDPRRLFFGADVVIFSGSLNTVEDHDLYPLLARAFDAAAEALVFNFLCSPVLAASDYLRWRNEADVLRFARTLSPIVRHRSDYLPGDCTVAISHPDDPALQSPARAPEASA